MPIDIATRFTFSTDRPSDVLLQFEAAVIPEQRILAQDTRIGDSHDVARIAAQDEIAQDVGRIVQVSAAHADAVGVAA